MADRSRISTGSRHQHSVLLSVEVEVRWSRGVDLKRLKGLEEEKNRLKKMYADKALGNRVVKDLLGKF
jgi:hypothetical protein